jgi:integrase
VKPKLPRHWIQNHGAYFYRPPKRYQHLFEKKWVLLGHSLAEAHKTFGGLPIHDNTGIKLIRDLAERYELTVVPSKAPGTQENNHRALNEIRAVFGHIPINKIEPSHCYQYYEAKSGSRSARATLEVLRHMFTKAVEWGGLKRHPLKGQLVLKRNPPRDRYVTDEELRNFQAFASPKLRAYIDLKMVTGLSKEDILCLDRSDIKTDGVHTRRRKTRSRPKVYLWDEEGVLKGIIQAVFNAHRGHVGSTRLFHTRDGNPYYTTNEAGYAVGKPDGFNSMWQRLMSKWVSQGGARFTEHDLRAKAASDTSLEHAQILLDHRSSDTTEEIYRRAPKVVNIATKVVPDA